MNIPGFVKDLKFSDVKLIEMGESIKRVYYKIYFKITPDEKTIFEISFKKNKKEGNYEMHHLIHSVEFGNECYYCGEEDDMCYLLEHVKDEILEMLLQHPNIRMKLLF